MNKVNNLIALRDLLDKLIDAEQSGEGEQANEHLPVVAAWPDVSMIRIKDVAILTHTGRIPLFGIKAGERYVQLQLA